MKRNLKYFSLITRQSSCLTACVTCLEPNCPVVLYSGWGVGQKGWDLGHVQWGGGGSAMYEPPPPPLVNRRTPVKTFLNNVVGNESIMLDWQISGFGASISTQISSLSLQILGISRDKLLLTSLQLSSSFVVVLVDKSAYFRFLISLFSKAPEEC